MASRAVESDKLSSLHLAKNVVFCFYLIHFKSQIKVLADFIKCTSLSFSRKSALRIGFVVMRLI